MLSEEVVLKTLKCGKDQYPHILEKQFPHVLEKIIDMWNSPEFGPFMADMMQSNGRGGGRLDRGGFPKPAWQEMYKLAELHMKISSR